MTQPRDVRVLFMGSPGFAVPSLRAVVNAGYVVVAVVTQPDRPAGRGGRMTPPAVKKAAELLGFPVIQPESLKDPATEAALRASAPDVIVVAAYGKILPRAVLAIPTRGCLNVHASLLPRWRGASPIVAAILAGDAETGITIMEMAPKMDAGAIVLQRTIELLPDARAWIYEELLASMGARTLIDALPRWYDRELLAVAQDESQATYCSLVKKTDGYLRAEMSTAEADRAVRAYEPWPRASVGYRDGRLAISQARVAPLPATPELGAMIVLNSEPAIAFRDGLLVLEEVQKPGGRRISGAQLVNGERGVLPSVAGLV